MGKVTTNGNSNLRNSNAFDTNDVKPDRKLSIDPNILWGLSCAVSAEGEEPTLLSIPEIKARLASLKQSTNIPKTLTIVEKNQPKLSATDGSLSLPESNDMSKRTSDSVRLSCVKMENGTYTVLPTTNEMELAIKEECTESTKTFRRLPQHLTDHMRYDTPVFEPYVVDVPKQSIVVKKPKMTKRLKTGPVVPQLGRTFQKKFITASTRSIVVKKPKMNKRLKTGPVVQQPKRAFQKKIITASTKKQSVGKKCAERN